MIKPLLVTVVLLTRNTQRGNRETEQSNIIYLVRCFAILAVCDAFIWQGAFSKTDFYFFWVLIKSIEVKQLMICLSLKVKKNEQCNLHNNTMQEQVESKTGLKNLCSYTSVLGNAPARQMHSSLIRLI